MLLKGIQVLGFQMLTSPRTRPTSSPATRPSCSRLLAAGRAFPHIGARFPLDDTPAALRYVADGRAIGKVVLDVADPSA